MKKLDLARIRTWNLLIRSQTRYPLRHKTHRSDRLQYDLATCSAVFCWSKDESAFGPGNCTICSESATDHVKAISDCKDKILHRPGIEPGPPAWQARILPLNHRCL